VAPSLIAVLTVWGALALWYPLADHLYLRLAGVGIWAVFGGAMHALAWVHRSVGAGGFAPGFAALLVWWLRIEPINYRLWADDVSRMASGTVIGDRLLLLNVRNFDLRTNTDYTQRWETRSYDLKQLESVDLITSYWAYAAIAHVLVSFGFADGQHVVFSVEVRREKSQAFSELGGFFKEFELSVIAADERDIIRVRTNVRGEDDYLYRVALSPGARRSLLLAYVAEANRLLIEPRFYNTLTANCTTLVYHMMEHIVGHLPLDFRLVFSGYLPGYVYQERGLDRRYSLQELRSLGRITDRALAADRSANFSAAIRAGIPALTH
jgi:Domain of unknown function (DUF4105)